MKKVAVTLLILLLFGLFGFFFIAAKITDGQLNILERHEYGLIPDTIQRIHNQLLIADWHADNLLWDRNFLVESGHGHVDLPRLITGNFTLQVFSAVTKTPKNQNYISNSGNSDNITLLAMANRWPVASWSSLLERALYQARKLHAAEDGSDGRFKVIVNKTDLADLLEERKEDNLPVGGILAIEGLHVLEGRLDHLNKLYDSGFRVLGLTHFFDNEVGGSSAGIDQNGLTKFGNSVIEQMNEKNLIIDLAHAAPALINDVLVKSSKPVIVSHTGVQGIHKSPRNLSDDQIRAIASKGGMIGIGFWAGAIGSTRPQAIARTIRYVADLVGISFVSLGSDWDGSTTTYFDAAHIWVLTQALVNEGFAKEEIQLIMGGNQIRFLTENLPD